MDPSMQTVGAESRALPHPIATLMHEHRMILGVLAEMEHACGTLGGSGTLRQAFWRNTMQFLAEFDGQIHHDKEEGLLFPALEAAGLSPDTGPTAVLRSEHGLCRLWRGSIAEAIECGDPLQLLAAVQGFVDLERMHIMKESQILFPLAKQLLSPAVFERMARAFAELDKNAQLTQRTAVLGRRRS